MIAVKTTVNLMFCLSEFNQHSHRMRIDVSVHFGSAEEVGTLGSSPVWVIECI